VTSRRVLLDLLSLGPLACLRTPAQVDERVLWRVNYEVELAYAHGNLAADSAAQEFNRRFRHQMCVDLIKLKLGQDASEVVAAMLRESRPHETHLGAERSTPLTQQAICDEIARAQAANECSVGPDQIVGASRRAPDLHLPHLPPSHSEAPGG